MAPAAVRGDGGTVDRRWRGRMGRFVYWMNVSLDLKIEAGEKNYHKAS